MISKELLSEVLGVYVRDGWYFDCEILIYTYDKILGLDENYHAEINIYELAHKCKEYARSYDYYIESVVFEYGSRAFVHKKYVHNPLEILNDKTEPAVIFKACEYILKEIK